MLTPETQIRLLKEAFPGIEVFHEIHPEPWAQRLRFEHVVHPPLSNIYRVEFIYAFNENGPRVTILSPPIQEERNGKRAPHFNHDKTLCLFTPDMNEWDGSKPLTNIVHWTICWIFHYEHWLAFDEWLGDPPKKNTPAPPPPQQTPPALTPVKVPDAQTLPCPLPVGWRYARSIFRHRPV